MSVLIKKLLEITHAQWIYHNIVIHGAALGELITKKKKKLQIKIEKLLKL